MQNREYDYLFKFVIIGNSNVGKSSILMRFSDDQFNESYLTTIGVDFRFKTLNIDQKLIKLQIWDTAGQERFRTITNAYYKGADVIVLVYDISNNESFQDIEKFWLKEVENYAEKDVELILLGNKCDLDAQRTIDTIQVQEYAEKKGMEFYETSAKTNESIEKAFVNIGKKLIAKKIAIMEAKKAKKRAQRNKKNGVDNSICTDVDNQAIQEKENEKDDSQSNYQNKVHLSQKNNNDDQNAKKKYNFNMENCYCI
ncbi:Ras family protein, putative [Ichthyophthirius multifiliis]|uniref:Ras family protein, putative n=1 Tax=Ichthyophthirius multifiliis TaxID=5932 RepID=G0R405_ICHMU|nr:Ras family protein, putative [Ichthyophthirius multifiliis]EGR27802.1 Ras family protein, putative [Ichthyophthirius multifiliis]|eukprot:XP_004027147.1 Ras family protein, putative [Ichthyophthirius multifiliis]